MTTILQKPKTRKRNRSVRPCTRYVSGAWVVYWRYDYKQYSVSTGLLGNSPKEKRLAEVIASTLNAALAANAPTIDDFPADYRSAPAVERYITDRTGVVLNKPTFSPDWIHDYNQDQTGHVSEKWAMESISNLRRLDRFTDPAWEKERVKARIAEREAMTKAALAANRKDVDSPNQWKRDWKSLKTKDDYEGGGITTTTPEQARDFMNMIVKAGMSMARYNRTLMMCHKFFGWAVKTGRASINPFAGIPQKKEPKKVDITYNTREERDALIDIAYQMRSEVPDWMIVPLTYLGGMRREEAVLAKWQYLQLGKTAETNLLTLVETKTGDQRRIPLHPYLVKIFSEVPEKDRTDYIIKMPEGITSRKDRADTVLNYVARRAAQLEKPIPKSRIGWNIIRHTFGTLLAQSGGVTIDTISEIMGNSPQVCRRHYINFIPKNGGITAINNL